jgi:hypothetical protein
MLPLSRRAAAVLALVFTVCPPGWGWGRQIHALIARMAEARLNARARAEVKALLGEGVTLESIASWADEVRSQRPETGTWHYIDIPITEQRGDWHKFCPETGCVPEIIPKMEVRLRDRSLPADQRREALKFLVHFVADLHQPLHVGENHDRGGNDVRVVFFNQPSNLHSVWDTALPVRLLKDHPNWEKSLERGPGRRRSRALARGTLDDWVWESQAASAQCVYANLPPERPALLGQEYLDNAAPVVRLQIERAGVRLARVLNETLGR